MRAPHRLTYQPPGRERLRPQQPGSRRICSAQSLQIRSSADRVAAAENENGGHSTPAVYEIPPTAAIPGGPEPLIARKALMIS